MSEAVATKDRLSEIREKIAEADGGLEVLSGQLDSARKQVEARQQQIAETESELAKLQTAYNEECRKIADGKKGKPGDIANRRAELGPKLDGLELLLGDEQGRVTDLEQQITGTTGRLAKLRDSEQQEESRLELTAVATELNEAIAGWTAKVNEVKRRLATEKFSDSHQMTLRIFHDGLFRLGEALGPLRHIHFSPPGW